MGPDSGPTSAAAAAAGVTASSATVGGAAKREAGSAAGLEDCGGVAAETGEASLRGEGASTAAGFTSVEAVALSGNCIGDWGAVDRLGGLPALRSLRFGGNPVTSGLGASEVKIYWRRGWVHFFVCFLN